MIVCVVQEAQTIVVLSAIQSAISVFFMFTYIRKELNHYHQNQIRD